MSGSSAVPETLYKYLPPARADIFETGTVRFSQPSVLNDPLEASIRWRLVRDLHQQARAEAAKPVTAEVFHRLLAEKPELAAQFLRSEDSYWPLVALDLQTRLERGLAKGAHERHQRMVGAAIVDVFDTTAADLREMETIVEDQLRLFSCTARAASVPMWAYYAGNHRGFLIGFDPSRMFAAHGDAVSAARPILYVTDEGADETGGTDDTLDFTLTKMVDWAYEQEWRFVQFLNDRQSPLTLLDFDMSAIKEVTFGLLAEDETIQRVRGALTAKGHAPLLSKMVLADGYKFKSAPLE